MAGLEHGRWEESVDEINPDTYVISIIHNIIYVLLHMAVYNNIS